MANPSCDLTFLRRGATNAVPGDSLGQLWEAVRVRLPEDEDDDLGRVHIGRAGSGPDAIPWAHTNHDEERVNLTLELKPEWLELNVVGWKMNQAHALKQWLQSVEGEQVIERLPGYDVVAYKRRAYKRTPESRPWWQDETVEQLGVCPASAFNAGWISKHMIGFGSSGDEKLALHLRRRWSRGEGSTPGDSLIDEIAAEVPRLLPILRRVWAKPVTDR